MPGDYRGKRGEAQSYIPTLVREGATNAEIMDLLQLNDLGYTPQSMRNDINRFRLEELGAAEIKGLSEHTPIPERYMRTWHGDTEYNYRVVVKYEFFDQTTGTTGVSGTTLYFDHPPTQNEVQEYFEAQKSGIADRYNNVEEIYAPTKVLYYKNK